MSNQPNGDYDGNQRPRRNITGPQSALTDFLASHNISAQQIRDSADQRRQAAIQQAQENGGGENPEAAEEVETSPVQARRSSRRQSAVNAGEANAQAAKEKTIEKSKGGRALKKRKKGANSDDNSDDEIARALFNERHAPLPGQMGNCAMCDKRFTVTPYSVAGPDGGLLCAPCGREVAKERQGQQPKKKKKPTPARRQTGGIGARRAVQSRLLDGDVGAKSLSTLCVQTLAKNVDMAESLGDLPEHLVDKIARIFSKQRLLRAETLPLFVQPGTEMVHIYDGARLNERDLMSIFQVTGSHLRRFKAKCAIQFKDSVMDYVLSREAMQLESFYLHGANLLSEEKWHQFLRAKGGPLRTLQVYYTDRHFGDETVGVIKTHCPAIEKVKIENNQKVGDAGVRTLAEIPTLRHIGLRLRHSLSPSAISHAVTGVGANLVTLSLNAVPLADDNVLAAIRTHCRRLTKLRITESEHMTDAGFAGLFSGWQNQALEFLDLEKCRYVSASKPRDNEDHVGLCSRGFKALMAHSGSGLRKLNVHACRNISRQAFEDVFGGAQLYPELRKLEISFCEEVTDYILGCIFRSCPRIREVNVFGCMKVKDVRVPRGVILVGVPNAQGMVTEGVD
ncbi:DNA repair protein RAD7 [Geosmithia morbida]|uniref:DNA repair protein RAD7 n=1 Tax=Geosmithia morbida TaxID=1094350 RepID=A0A9P4YPF0_9HYPO|nr:DNA repair protein RAD7 [Geosmithia morbida]KAF4120696.1 DNA repair protein RAD7 [Geosmithia morbida]